MPKLLNLKNFMEHFDNTRRVTTNDAKITHIILNFQQFIHFRYDLTD
jgi:hypothetical protein